MRQGRKRALPALDVAALSAGLSSGACACGRSDGRSLRPTARRHSVAIASAPSAHGATLRRPQLQVPAGRAVDLRAAADRRVPAGLPAGGEFPGHHHDGHRHQLLGPAQLRAVVPRRAVVGGAAAHAVFTAIALPIELVLGLGDGAAVHRSAARAGRSSSRCWCCRWWSRRSSRAPPGR